MAFNGSGVFQLYAGNPVVTGTVISSTWANNTLSDIANNGLTNCITKDGQQTVTNNIPFNNNRLTGVGNAVNLQDAVTATQMQNNGLITLGGVSGTDTITASPSPAITAYATGQRFQFLPAGSNATTTVTLNLSGLGAKNVLKPTQAGLVALAAGDIQSAAMQTVIYDGTQFQLETPGFVNGGRLLRITPIQASTSFSFLGSTNSWRLRAVGPGGPSGGTAATSNGQSACSQSGSGGAACEAFFNTVPAGGLTVTIGTLGTGGAAGANAGTQGTATTVTGTGISVSCPPGTAGVGASGTASVVITSGASQTAQCTITGAQQVILNVPGGASGTGVIANPGASQVAPGQGGSSLYSPGSSLTGNVPTGSYGAGAPSRTAGASSGAQAGFNGGAGWVEIEEYA